MLILNPSRSYWRQLLFLSIASFVLFVSGVQCGFDRGLPGHIPSDDLLPLWEIWEVLDEEFVDHEALDADLLSDTAIKELSTALGQEQYSKIDLNRELGYRVPKEVPGELERVWSTWASIFEDVHDSSINPPDVKMLAYATIRGFLNGLDDPHTYYVTPDRNESFSQDFEGMYEGIGTEIHKRGSSFLLNPMPGSPAEDAGIRAGDTLLAVNKQPVDNMEILDLVNIIRGPRGTMVLLEIQHLQDELSVEIEIQRGEIIVSSISWNMTNDQIAYVRLRAFYSNSDEAMDVVLQEIHREGALGLVLDLRNNPGGYVDTTISIVSQFLDDGIVAYEINGSGHREDWEMRKGGLALDIPLILLVNQYSASSSEILLGALQDFDRALAVGMPTFGKGTVNRLRLLSNGGGLMYSYARWYTPNGILIEGAGLDPDVEILQSPNLQPGAVDLQLEKALDLIKSEILAGTSN